MNEKDFIFIKLRNLIAFNLYSHHVTSLLMYAIGQKVWVKIGT